MEQPDCLRSLQVLDLQESNHRLEGCKIQPGCLCEFLRRSCHGTALPAPPVCPHAVATAIRVLMGNYLEALNPIPFCTPGAGTGPYRCPTGAVGSLCPGRAPARRPRSGVLPSKGRPGSQGRVSSQAAGQTEAGQPSRASASAGGAVHVTQAESRPAGRAPVPGAGGGPPRPPPPPGGPGPGAGPPSRDGEERPAAGPARGSAAPLRPEGGGQGKPHTGAGRRGATRRLRRDSRGPAAPRTRPCATHCRCPGG